jgi:signal transduction histidine kinase
VSDNRPGDDPPDQAVEIAALRRALEERTSELDAARKKLEKNGGLAVLGQLVSTVVHELRGPLGAMLTSVHLVESRIGDADPATKKGIERIRRGVVNVIENASQAISDGGKPGHIEVRTRPDGGHVEIRIADNGPGIRDDIAPRFSNRFSAPESRASASGCRSPGALSSSMAARSRWQATRTAAIRALFSACPPARKIAPRPEGSHPRLLLTRPA